MMSGRLILQKIVHRHNVVIISRHLLVLQIVSVGKIQLESQISSLMSGTT